MNFVILLTACVNPNGMAYTKIQNSDIRLKQYLSALDWYLNNTMLPIVVVENTMTDFSSDYIKYIDTGRLEFITFDGNNYDRSLGKGYGEALIIKKALDNSKLISNAIGIFKITGRLILKNINQIQKCISHTDSVYSNTYLSNGLCSSQSAVFYSPKKFLDDYFIPDIDMLNDSEGHYFEHLLFQSELNWIKSGHKHYEFILPLIIEGVSGSTGLKYYHKNRLNHIKSLIKYLFHKAHIYKNHIRK